MTKPLPANIEHALNHIIGDIEGHYTYKTRPEREREYIRKCESVIRSALTSGAAGEWMPIETAPKCIPSTKGDNGMRPVLVCRVPYTSGYAPMTMAMSKGGEWLGPANQKLKFQPTHWMPLPPAPDQAALPPRPVEGEDDIAGLHSKIDMDIEDEIGREVTLEESRLIGLAIRKARTS